MAVQHPTGFQLAAAGSSFSTVRHLVQPRALVAWLLAIGVSLSIWLGLPELNAQARIALIAFGLAVVGWVCTNINDTYVALAAALVCVVGGLKQPEAFFETLGDSTIWLLLASFVVAAAVTASGLSRRLTMWVAARARSVSHLFYLLTGVLLSTAFVIPSTSGRAALMLPIFLALSTALGNPRISRALALLFPTIILLSAVASLIGAGAHLVAVEVLWRMGGERISFGRWLLLGLPFALVSCFMSTWVILHLFLNRHERRKPVALPAELAAPGQDGKPLGPPSRQERYVLRVVAALVLVWSTESLHGIHTTMVALVGALLLTMPQFGPISFKAAMKQVEWQLLLFMAATLELGRVLVETGAAQWLVQHVFGTLQGHFSNSPLAVVSIVVGVSLLSHLLVTSRTARSSVLVPLVILLALSLGYNPTAFVFVSTAAAGFCLTLMVSAKPLGLFGQLEQVHFMPRHLAMLSAVLLPLHFGLLLVFAWFVWPVLGLSFHHETTNAAPQQLAALFGWLMSQIPALETTWITLQQQWQWLGAQAATWWQELHRAVLIWWVELGQPAPLHQPAPAPALPTAANTLAYATHT